MQSDNNNNRQTAVRYKYIFQGLLGLESLDIDLCRKQEKPGDLIQTDTGRQQAGSLWSSLGPQVLTVSLQFKTW